MKLFSTAMITEVTDVDAALSQSRRLARLPIFGQRPSGCPSALSVAAGDRPSWIALWPRSVTPAGIPG
jgi:hypothetical protein